MRRIVLILGSLILSPVFAEDCARYLQHPTVLRLSSLYSARTTSVDLTEGDKSSRTRWKCQIVGKRETAIDMDVFAIYIDANGSAEVAYNFPQLADAAQQKYGHQAIVTDT